MYMEIQRQYRCQDELDMIIGSTVEIGTRSSAGAFSMDPGDTVGRKNPAQCKTT